MLDAQLKMLAQSHPGAQVSFSWVYLVSKTECHHIEQAGLELVILPHQPPKC